MPLAVNSECMPVIVCDECGQEIVDAADGNYEWLPDDEEDTPRPRRVYFTHKRCCLAFEHRHGGRWCSLELNCLPVFLVQNLRIDWQAAKALARRLAG